MSLQRLFIAFDRINTVVASAIVVALLGGGRYAVSRPSA